MRLPPGEDMDERPEDMGGAQASRCVVDDVTPRTLPVDVTSTQVTWTIRCDGALTTEQVGQAPAIRRGREGAPALTVTAAELIPGEVVDQEYGFELTLALEQALEGELDTAQLIEGVGVEELTLETASAVTLQAQTRWRVPTSRLGELQTERDLHALPAGYAERGLALEIRQIEIGRVLAGVMLTEDLQAIELFTVDPQGEVLVHKEVALGPDQLGAWGLEVQEVNGGVDALWWGLEEATGQLRGVSAFVDAGGVPQSVDELEPTSYQGPTLTEIVDSTSGITEIGGALRTSGRLLARTDTGALAVVRLADAEGASRVSLERQLDGLGGIAVAELSDDQFGLLDPGAGADLDTDVGQTWLVDQNGKLSLSQLDGAALPGAATLTSVQWPFRLELERVSAGRLVAMIKGQDARELKLVEIDGEGNLSGQVTLLDLPEGVILGGFPDVSSSVIGGTLSSDGEHYSRLGIVPLSLTGEHVPVSVRWDLSQASSDKAAPVVMVRPAVAQDPSAARDAADGERVLGRVTSDGWLEVRRAAPLTQLCSDSSECAHPITGTTLRGLRLNLVPGETGPAWAVDKYGDILIDGVPLVFDLTAPPIIIDAPGAQGVQAVVLASLAHESASHAVWTVDARGALSETGLLNVAGGGDAQVVFTEGEGDEGDEDEGIPGLELTIGTVLIDFSQGEGDQERAAAVRVPLEDLTAAVGADGPVTLDLSSQLPGPGEGAQDIAVLAPSTSAPVEYPAPDSPQTQVLAELTDAQAARPVVLEQVGDEVIVRIQDEQGQWIELARTTLEGEPAEGGLFDEGNTGWSTNLHRRRTTRRRMTRRRRRRRRSLSRNEDTKSNNSSSQSISAIIDVAYTNVAGEDDVDMDSAENTTSSINDINGDGFEDHEFLSTYPPDHPEYPGQRVSTWLLDDGEGGVLDTPFVIPGGVDTGWSEGSMLDYDKNITSIK